MVKGLHSQDLPADVAHVVDQLERHCLAPDGSLISKPLYNDLQLAREEMCRERLRYLEAMIGFKPSALSLQSKPIVHLLSLKLFCLEEVCDEVLK
ncbi:AUGMIN subunit 4-like [Vicia villosa]|uniref:AUGMIN subunit 4-like n=1 Tax=Vicia villosa TaxID=3911 RepID=UPI00273BA68F|nr:AUGMIN subunit 4-like [Vicia villosa]XP_058742724.1 AUGMIN subunit 4-like [Vicia villosa]XP_058756199.1 AUGMIN subunit 4-like [Vicia villosa]